MRNLSEIKKSGELRIGYGHTVPVSKGGFKSGPDFELAAHIAQNMGLRAVGKQFKYWNELFEREKGNVAAGDSYIPRLFKKGLCDLYAIPITPTVNRGKILSWIEMYKSFDVIAIDKKKLSEFKNIQSLEGKKTNIISHTTFEKMLLELNKSRFKRNPIILNKSKACNGKTQVEDLVHGEIDFILSGLPEALISKHHLYQDLEITFPVACSYDVNWAISHGNTELKKTIIKIISDFKENPHSSMNYIFKKYYGLDYTDYREVLKKLGRHETARMV